MKFSVGTMSVVIALFVAPACHAQEKSFDSGGTKIHYRVAGKGEPVVLIHGFISSHEEWTVPPPFLPPAQRDKFQTVFATLSRDYMVIAPDCRGHGKSGKPKDAKQYGIEMVRDIVRLLDHLKIKKAHVVGYSMGAFLAAKVVEAHPDRVKSAVLGGGGAVLDGSQELAFMLSLGKSLKDGRGVEPLIVGMSPPGQPKPSSEQIKQMNKMFLTNQDEKALMHVALGHKQLTVSRAKLESSPVSTLLIVGGKDPLKSSSEATHKLMPKSRLVIVKGKDHISAEMSPEFLKNIQSFLKNPAP